MLANHASLLRQGSYRRLLSKPQFRTTHLRLSSTQPPAASSSSSATAAASPARGWRKYAHQFRNHPASHLVSFALLHELTAVIPLPLIYFLLSTTELPIPFPDDILADGNRRMGKMLKYFGVGEGIREDSKAMLYMATSYAVVKAAMPLRIGLCFVLTPWFARVAVVPVQNGVRRFAGLFGRSKSS